MNRSATSGLEPQTCVGQFNASPDFTLLRRVLRQADEEWMKQFLECDGMKAIFDALSAFISPRYEGYSEDDLRDILPQLECVECLKAVMNSQHGMEATIRSESGKYVTRLVLG